MKAWNAGTVSALEGGRVSMRVLMFIDIAEGAQYFWSGQGDLVYGGHTYVGAGSLIELSVLQQSLDLSSQSLTARLRSVPNSALTPDVLASVESYTYHQRAFTIHRAYWNPDTNAITSAELWAEGYVDRIDHNEQDGTNGKPGVYELVAHLETLARDHSKTGHRRRSDADQRLISSTDGGLRHAATALTKEIFWGRLDPNAAKETDVGRGGGGGTREK